MIDIKLEIALHNIDNNNELSDISKIIIDGFSSIITSHTLNNMTGMLDDDNDVLIISAHFERIMYKDYGLQVDDTRKLVQDFLDISEQGKYKVL